MTWQVGAFLLRKAWASFDKNKKAQMLKEQLDELKVLSTHRVRHLIEVHFDVSSSMGPQYHRDAMGRVLVEDGLARMLPQQHLNFPMFLIRPPAPDADEGKLTVNKESQENDQSGVFPMVNKNFLECKKEDNCSSHSVPLWGQVQEVCLGKHRVLSPHIPPPPATASRHSIRGIAQKSAEEKPADEEAHHSSAQTKAKEGKATALTEPGNCCVIM